MVEQCLLRPGGLATPPWEGVLPEAFESGEFAPLTLPCDVLP